MDKSFTLDKLFISGILDDDTPKCVLVDIADGNGLFGAERYSHSILMENLRKENNNLPKLLGLDYNDVMNCDIELMRTHAGIIARFVNPDKNIGWSFRVLIKAFRHMLSITSFNLTLNSNKIGPITPQEPLSYNACMLYRICKNYNIKLRPTTTIKQLHLAVNLLIDYYSNNLVIPKYFTPEVYISSMVDMDIKVGKLIEYNPIKDGNFEALRRFYDDISVPQKLYSRIDPRSHGEAVIIAALEFKIDISSSSSPLQELRKMQESKVYVPVDSSLKQRYERNSKWFSLKKNYSPNLAMVYDNDSLSMFVEGEALSEDEVLNSLPPQSRERREGLKNILFQARISQTFYHGWHPDASNYITPIEMDDMREQNYDTDSVVSFGSVEYCDLITFKTSELSDHFRVRGSFVNPLKPSENFSSTAIKKLKIICKTIKTINRKKKDITYNEEQRTNFSTLLATIDKVESSMLKLSSNAEEFKEIYDNSNDKEQIRNTFQKLLDAGMYMRGWKVSCPKDKLPLQSIDTVTPLGRQDEVSDYTNFGLAEFRDSLNKLSTEVSSKIKNLPLVCAQYNIDEKKPDFIQSVSPEDGLTIWDRYLIVKEGESSRKVSACIRMTSNWFVSSAYYYMSAIGMEKSFDICQMSKIS